jgi:hypothetical protein
MDEPHGLALERRGLSVETAVRLGWRPCAGPTSDDLWISIPYLDGGKVVGRKYRTITGKKLFTQQTGTPQIFWNVDCLRDPQLAGFPLVITEGEMDALAAIQCGYPRPCRCPAAHPTTTTAEQVLAVSDACPAAAQRQRPIVLAVDSDHNGQVLQAGLASRLGRSRCQILGTHRRDLNDVLIARRAGVRRRSRWRATCLAWPAAAERDPRARAQARARHLHPWPRAAPAYPARRFDCGYRAPWPWQVDIRQQSHLQHGLALARQDSDGVDGAVDRA